ncbi:MAG: hypothetical protein JWN94_3248 [Betaproteobacteria bacterium]|nr:hypothetical protein [Betaproteobacteria bacterium]
MKIAFIVHIEYYTERVLDMFTSVDIDYYTRWDQAKGKGHGTDPHLGAGGFPSTNSVVMVAFEDEKPLERLIDAINHANADIKRPADRIRLFQVPLERIV